MNWQKDKLTIIGFGIIFVILAVFGYILWDMNREPIAEISVTETTTAPVPVQTDPKIVDPDSVEKKELQDYQITKVDTTDWESQEFKLGDAGIRYKAPSFDKNLPNKYGLPKTYNLFRWNGSDKIDLSSDYLISVNPSGVATGGGYYLNPIEISIVESKDLSLENIFNVFSTQTCKYDIVEVPEEERFYDQKYNANPLCRTKEQVIGSVYKPGSIIDINTKATRVRESKRLDKVTALCLDGEKIEQFKNPFIVQNNNNKATNLIKCNSIFGVDNNKNIQKRKRELFILSLSNNKFAIINYQDTGIPGVSGIEKDNSQKINNLMHTILSTIEVL
jgi:hypothetical protein